MDGTMTAIFQAIGKAGGRTYLVGGAVRDQIRGIEPKDRDYLVTGLALEPLLVVLRSFGSAGLVGQSFGVVKFTPRGSSEMIDFALPRRERSTGVGHRDFEVECRPDLPIEVDLGRRDFTCNAIAEDALTSVRIDPHGGQADLEAKTLRMVHANAFAEDPLRMLRAVQFSARLGLTPDAALLARCSEQAGLVGTVSPERIAIELAKLLKAPKPSDGFRMMASTGLLRRVLPELADQEGVRQPRQYHAYDVFGHCLTACDQVPAKRANLVWLRLTALLHDIGKAATLTWRPDGEPQFLGHDAVGAEMAEAILARLKFSSVPDEAIPVDRIVHLIRHHMFDQDHESGAKALRRFVARVGPGYVMDLIRLRVGDRLGKGFPTDVSEWVSFARKLRCLRHGVKAAFSIRDLAIDGHEVMKALALKPGPRVGIELQRLLELVLEDPTRNTREHLLAALEAGL